MGSLKSNFLLLWKLLNFETLGTANQKQIKIGPDIYHLNTFGLPKNEGVNKGPGGGGAGGGGGASGTYKETPKNATRITMSWI